MNFSFVSSFNSFYECKHHSTQPWNQNLHFKSNFNGNERFRKLRIEFEPFDRIVPGFAEIFPNLKILEIKQQKIKFIEAKNFANLKELEELDLSENPLRTLKQNVFGNLGKLKTLSLSYCQLESLPAKIFSKLTQLEEIDLEHNQLTHLDKTFFANNLKLKEIHLNANKLQNIDVDFTSLVNIESIIMRRNDCINLSYYKTGPRTIPSTNSIQEFQSAINRDCTELV
jgi:Leucine-rich repeat (LRR) protein